MYCETEQTMEEKNTNMKWGKPWGWFRIGNTSVNSLFLKYTRKYICVYASVYVYMHMCMYMCMYRSMYMCVSLSPLSSKCTLPCLLCDKQWNSVKHFSFHVTMMLSFLSRGQWRDTTGGRGFLKFPEIVECGHGCCVGVRKSSKTWPSHWPRTQSLLWPHSLALVTTLLKFPWHQKPEPLPPVCTTSCPEGHTPSSHSFCQSPFSRPPHSILPPNSPCTPHQQLVLTCSPAYTPEGCLLLPSSAPVWLSQQTSLLSAG